MTERSSESLNEKHQRLHRLALSLYRDGDNISALRCWKRIQLEDPEFANIEKWIAISSQAQFKPPKSMKEARAKTIYKTQRQLMDNYGPRKKMRRRFQPRPSEGQFFSRIRHRHIAYMMLFGSILFLYSSFRNMRSFMMVTKQDSTSIQILQGTFFPFGWQETHEIEVGLMPGWEYSISNVVLKNDLASGKNVRGYEAVNQFILSLYLDLGENALRQQNEEKQQEAIYYFKRIERADYLDEVREKISRAYYNLASLKFRSGSGKNEALRLLRTAKTYYPTLSGLGELTEMVHQTDF